jgi:capsid protein
LRGKRLRIAKVELGDLNAVERCKSLRAVLTAYLVKRVVEAWLEVAVVQQLGKYHGLKAKVPR